MNQGDVVEPSEDTRINQDDFRINIYRAVPVRVVDGNKTSLIYSAATTSRSIARQAGFKPKAEDVLRTDPVTNFLSERNIGETVTIKRPFPLRLAAALSIALALCLAAAEPARADSVAVQRASLQADGTGWSLDARFDFVLNNSLEDAVNKGIPLESSSGAHQLSRGHALK